MSCFPCECVDFPLVQSKERYVRLSGEFELLFGMSECVNGCLYSMSLFYPVIG